MVSGETPSTRIPEYWGGNVIWFAPSDLTGYRSKFIDRGAKTLTDEGLAKSFAKVMPAGGVMFSSRAPVGYVAINSKPSATNQGFKSIVPHPELFNQYLYYYLKAAKHSAETRATGTTFKELSSSAFAALPIPIAPTNEQRRIVGRIEALFDEIDRGIESLRNAKRAIGLYRQSLLKSAFEGRLTAEWRAENPDKLENPETLLGEARTFRSACCRRTKMSVSSSSVAPESPILLNYRHGCLPASGASEGGKPGNTGTDRSGKRATRPAKPRQRKSGRDETDGSPGTPQPVAGSGTLHNFNGLA